MSTAKADTLAAARAATAKALDAYASAIKAHVNVDADGIIVARDQRDIAEQRLAKARQAEAEAQAAVEAEERASKAAKLSELRRTLDVAATTAAIRVIATERDKIEREHAAKLRTLVEGAERARAVHNARLALASDLAVELGEAVLEVCELPPSSIGAIHGIVTAEKNGTFDPGTAWLGIVPAFGFTPWGKQGIGLGELHPSSWHPRWSPAEQIAACLDGSFARRRNELRAAQAAPPVADRDIPPRALGAHAHTLLPRAVKAIRELELQYGGGNGGVRDEHRYGAIQRLTQADVNAKLMPHLEQHELFRRAMVKLGHWPAAPGHDDDIETEAEAAE